MTVQVTSFFDPATFSYSYLVVSGTDAAIIDPVFNFDPVSGRLTTASVEALLSAAEGLNVRWVLDTHIHADHLSGAQWLKQRLGARVGIGAEVVEVQTIFGGVFNCDTEFLTDGSQFDLLFADEHTLALGDTEIKVWHTPGHTPACVSYIVDDCVFVGDTFFMP